MKQILLGLLLFLSSKSTLSQNLITPDGLAYGQWKYVYENEIETGNYRILPISAYLITDSISNRIYKVKIDSVSALLYFQNKNATSLSVQDGIWIKTDSNGNIIKLENYLNGLEICEYEYDDISCQYTSKNWDYKKNEFVYLEYVDNRIVKRVFRSINGNLKLREYYPNDNLVLPLTYLEFESKFNNEPRITKELKLTAKNRILVQSISTSTNSLIIVPKNFNLPSILDKMDTLVIDIIYNPLSINFSNQGKLIIETFEKTHCSYAIDIDMRAYSFDALDIRNNKKLIISKEKDRYLYIPKFGTVTTATIANTSGFYQEYDLNDITNIDIVNYKIGDYTIEIGSCDFKGSIDISIIE